MTRVIRLAAVAAATLTCAAPATAIPPVDQFTQRVDNAWFPLVPGSTWIYRGVEDGQPARQVVKVTRRIKTILGVRCVVVDDRLYLGGRLAERTTDWFAQDRRGNVWYLGEATVEFDGSGQVTSTSGSWEAGVDGARAGLFMPAKPHVGFSRRQEFLRGEAEDHFRVLNLRGRADTPYVTSRDALVTEEWTPLEPGLLERKAYVRGIGLVAAGAADDDGDRIELVSYKPGKS